MRIEIEIIRGLALLEILKRLSQSTFNIDSSVIAVASYPPCIDCVLHSRLMKLLFGGKEI